MTATGAGCLLTLALAGCVTTIVVGSTDGGAGIDAPSDATGTCGPDPVSFTGASTCVWFVWNGSDCVRVTGCGCEGNCELPQPTYAACLAAHEACWTDACRGGGGLCPCRAIHVSVEPGCTDLMGWGWNGRGCVQYVGCACSGECSLLQRDDATCLSRYEACSTRFPCGAAACERGAEYCLGDATCVPAPCGGDATCTCLAASGIDPATCVEDGGGGVFVGP